MPSRSWIEVPIDQEVEGVPDEGYAPFFFPPEGAKLVFEFTQESFMKVLSALINGAALTYPDEWLQVVWDFLRNVEYPVSLCDEIAAAILTCEDVQLAIATLVGTPGPVQEAVRDLVITDPAINNYITDVTELAILTAGQRGENLLKPGQCDPDYTFNQASKLVFLLDQLVTDLFQAIEVGTNSLERASLLISAIPGVGILPFDEILKFGDELVDNIQEDYAGNYDQGMYDDLRCGLFCSFKDSCELNIDEALAFYQDKLGSTLPANPIETFTAIMQFLITGDIPGDYTVYGMHILVIAAMRAGQELFGINFAQLGVRIVAAGDDPDNDWETLCGDCPPEGCVGTWPDPITSFYQGDITGRTGDVYSVSLVNDPITGYDIVRTSEYGDWSQGEFLLTEVEVIGATPFQLYAEAGDGSVIYDGQDVNALNAALPGCVRYFQAVKRFDTGSFTLKLTIET